MFKEGEEVELNGRNYIISPCNYAPRYKACQFCASVNIKPPCIESFDYPDSNTNFGLRDCVKNMPLGFIPKRLLQCQK